ncbi:MAG: serine dehydratase subunit alpha family protein [Dysgonomonas mossii]|uniref:L-cysteine desulfidase family protein n=1 Tax=Dysgonomonas mossii TaxID=163665 RepID=UPI001DACD726|nr:L-serine ammonia-lyase, iron-sulfur-dependent, subunit alpha [Dysgonomonas mossii]MBS5797321.1 serine dehydratase subunit alpha family protein [Dysgonomonas mossii]MBS7111336.1 serine dehydratase subunit alpha family protein [Dysgonomonas mossii]
MLNECERSLIINLIKKEVVPAIGCTEPIAVSLCVAKATEVLETVPEKIKVYLSANILKNAMGVGIPGTKMVGLPIAIALGALIGKSEYGLQVLKDLKPEDVDTGKKYIAEKRIEIGLKEDIDDNLYIEVHCLKNEKEAVAIIKGTHTHFSHISKNGEVIINECDSNHCEESKDEIKLSFSKVYEFATTTPIEDIRFILQAAELNRTASKLSAQGSYGHNVAKTMTGTLGKKIFGDSMLTHMMSYTAAACDARMDGAMIPVMSNSGSGNQGITATLPVLTYAEDTNCSEESLIRALILSHLTVVYIKQKLGRLSALCGCVAAATGASCGITYLMGGDYNQITFAVKNMVGNITGMICDGAKPSCALKISSGVSTAVLSAIMAMEQKVVSSLEGIVDDDVDKTIENLTSIGAVGMQETDKLVLKIMTSK